MLPRTEYYVGTFARLYMYVLDVGSDPLASRPLGHVPGHERCRRTDRPCLQVTARIAGHFGRASSPCDGEQCCVFPGQVRLRPRLPRDKINGLRLPGGELRNDDGFDSISGAQGALMVFSAARPAPWASKSAFDALELSVQTQEHSRSSPGLARTLHVVLHNLCETRNHDYKMPVTENFALETFCVRTAL